MPIDKARDHRWSKAVKARDEFKCRFCGASTGLESAHIVPRGNKHTRYLLSNGLTLCGAFGCSTHGNHHALKAEDRDKADIRIVHILGQAMVDALHQIAKGDTHDFEEVV